jgi:hypothetical protein
MTKRCRGLVAMLGTLAVFVTTRTADVFAISLDNDVDVSWSNLGTCPVGLCKIQVFGAPRVVQVDPPGSTPTKEDLSGLQIVISKGDGSVDFDSVKLSLKFIGKPVTYTFAFRRPPGDPDSFFDKYPDGVLSVDAFETEPFPSFATSQLAFVVAGTFITTAGSKAKAGVALPTVTVSGIGNEIRVDTVGDVENFDPGDAEDIPPRTLNIVRVLSELASASIGIRAVELDAAPQLRAERDRSTGLTHLFTPAAIARIQTATLELCVASDHFHSNDLVLLDQGVREVARGQLDVQVIRFKDILPSEPVPCGVGNHGHVLTIDLAAVPTNFIYPSPAHSHVLIQGGTRNLLRELGDGRLNVIIVGQTSLDYSHLTIVLRNSDDR